MRIKSKMIACRLSEDEYRQLMDLLDLDESSSQDCFSNKFRSLLSLLDGRLYLDNMDYLRLRPAQGDMDPKDLEELEKASTQDLYSLLS